MLCSVNDSVCLVDDVVWVVLLMLMMNGWWC